MSGPSLDADAVRGLAFFTELADDDLVRVMRVGRRRTFGTGQRLVELGSDAGGLFVLLSGRVSVDAGGGIQELGRGEFFGEMALLDREEPAGGGAADYFGEHPALDRGRRSATVTAVEPGEVLVIETIYLEAFLRENPTVAVEILRGVVRRLRDLEARLEAGG